MVLQQIVINMKLHNLVILLPKQLNNDLYLNLKYNLKRKVEKKCISAGYIYKVLSIEDYSNGYMIPEDLNGNIIFKIIYIASVCNPIVGNQMICKIDKFIKNVILCKNGAVTIIITTNNINVSLFKINNQGALIYTVTDTKLTTNNYLKITIKSKRSYTGDNVIGIIGFIDDIATNDEINEYMYVPDEHDNDISIEDNDENIEITEDNFDIE